MRQGTGRQHANCSAAVGGAPAAARGRCSKTSKPIETLLGASQFLERVELKSVAAEQRQKVAHGVSRGREVAQWMRSPGRGERNKTNNSFAAPRLLLFNATSPRLAPWATF